MHFGLPIYAIEVPVFGIEKELNDRLDPHHFIANVLKKLTSSLSGATYIFPLMFAIFNAVYWVLYLYVIRSFDLYLLISVSI